MIRSILPAIVICLNLFVLSCKSDEGGYLPGTSTLPAAASPVSSTDSLKPGRFTQPQQSTSPVPTQQTVTTVTPTQATTTTVTVAKGMNPPHGQPNHRCDIPVGAPLNSKPQVNTGTGTIVQPISSSTVQYATPNKVAAPATPTAAGMNPPHGQAGHRCDIAVGAPLNSKPAAQQATQVQATPDPVKKDSTSGQ